MRTWNLLSAVLRPVRLLVLVPGQLLPEAAAVRALPGLQLLPGLLLSEADALSALPDLQLLPGRLLSQAHRDPRHLAVLSAVEMLPSVARPS
jgi:hypothetical protein